jgi:hypothetical protein
MNIIQALDDPKVFGKHFHSPSWDVWRVFLAALFALPMTPDQLAAYQRYTGRTTPPTAPIYEAWLCIGRRGGKSFILATIAVFLACFTDWRPFLGPGEVATIMIIARDRRQARVIKRFITGLLKSIPMLAQVIEGETQETIMLRNSVAIEIHTASFRSTRGYTIVAALLDEIAYWEVDETSAEPDVEVINAIRPGMATVPGAIMLAASSPHARKGALWNAYQKHFAKDRDEVLVWQAATRDMNASVRQSYIDAHVADDPARAAAEYGAQFRTDIEGFVSIEVVRACVSAGVYERAPQRGISYSAFCDPSGGSSDSMTLCIGHRDYARDVVVIDALREIKPPFSPEQACQDFAATMKSYRVTRCTGDKYGGIWPTEQFSKFGIAYEAAAAPKSDLYRDMLPLLNSARIELLDHPKLISQLCGLERRTSRGGRDSIDHAPGAHDDLCNAVAGLASVANQHGGYNTNFKQWIDGDDSTDDRDAAASWRVSRLLDHIGRFG